MSVDSGTRRENGDGESPSKSQIKRDMLALQRLGERLLALSPERVGRIPLSDGFRAALQETHAIKAHGARRRQIRRLGKLLRNEEEAAVRGLLEDIDTQDSQTNHRFHVWERWRDRLLNEGRTALTEFVDEHPQADVQQLRQLIRSAQREQAEDRPPQASRKLFRYIRDLG